MKTYQINLPDDLAVLADHALAEKKWGTLDNLVADAIVSELESDTDHDTASLRDAVRVGIEQADSGEVTDGEAVRKRLRDKFEAARKQPT